MSQVSACLQLQTHCVLLQPDFSCHCGYTGRRIPTCEPGSVHSTLPAGGLMKAGLGQAVVNVDQRNSGVGLITVKIAFVVGLRKILRYCQ